MLPGGVEAVLQGAGRGDIILCRGYLSACFEWRGYCNPFQKRYLPLEIFPMMCQGTAKKRLDVRFTGKGNIMRFLHGYYRLT